MSKRKTDAQKVGETILAAMDGAVTTQLDEMQASINQILKKVTDQGKLQQEIIKTQQEHTKKLDALSVQVEISRVRSLNREKGGHEELEPVANAQGVVPEGVPRTFDGVYALLPARLSALLRQYGILGNDVAGPEALLANMRLLTTYLGRK